ncbi:MAG: sugar-binding protein [Victivallales bacterium]
MQKSTSLKRVLPLAAVIAAGAMIPSGFAAENMIGRQSQNEGILVLPASGPVKVDGDLSDWDLSGKIQIFAEYTLRDRFSAEAAAMWDKDAIYVCVRWRDPNPMNSSVDPKLNPGDGWKADALQLRVQTTDQSSWITTWFFSDRGEPVLDLTKWKNKSNSRDGTEGRLFIGENGKTNLGEGIELAYKKDADGKGFVQELRMPWSHIHRNLPEIKPGYKLRIGMEFIWADPTGRGWPVHRYADNMQPGKTSREFFWTAVDNWGNAELVDKGNVTPRKYAPEIERIAGTVPVKVEIPANAKSFTIAIEDSPSTGSGQASGRRVRNLAGDCDPEIYGTGIKDGKRTVEVLWDCLDDSGKAVQPGNYKVRGLVRGAISAEYDMCYYNPGNPTWKTKDGKGAWGADHHPPRAVLSSGDIVVVTWIFAEGGYGIIGLGPDEKKIWSQYRGAECAAVDSEYVYAYQSVHWHSAGMKSDFLCRYSLKDGSEKPFVIDGKERPFDLSLKDILGRIYDDASANIKPSSATDQDKEAGAIAGMAAKSGVIVLALSCDKIAVLEAATAKLVKTIDAKNPSSLAFDPQGQLFALLDGAVNRIDLEKGTAIAIPTPGVEKAICITFDKSGNLLVADKGRDSQVKAFDKDGKIAYTCGKKGGRPIRGIFDEQAMSHLGAVAVDAKGNIWVTENWDYPRRVSVWGHPSAGSGQGDGKLIRDYIGNTGYSGAGTYLHEQDPSLAYYGPVEMKIDHKARSYKVTKILWVPDESKGEKFIIPGQSNVFPQRFHKEVSGVQREYMYHRGEGGPHVIFMEFPDGWRPTSAICVIGQLLNLMDYHGVPSAMPSGEWAGLDPADGCFWNDANGDGIPQRPECVIVPAAKKSQLGKSCVPHLALRLNNGWGGRIGPDFSIYAGSLEKGVVRYRPTKLTAEGVPVYGSGGIEEIGVKAIGDMIPSSDGKSLVCIGANHGGPALPFLSVTLADKKIEWTYPNLYAGVHGSHRATMPKPGLLIGPLKVCGVADMGKEIGGIMLIRGNLGQDFLFTMDGLFIASIFQDCRLPAESLPDSEEKLAGMPLETFSEGGEPFNGWFGRQDDGKIRQSCGIPGQAGMIMEIKGLDTIRKFDAGSLSLDSASVAKALADNTAREAKVKESSKGVITRMPTPPSLKGEAKNWENVPGITVSREGQADKATVKLGYDDKNLYAFFDVSDPTPWLNEGKDFTRLFKTGDAVDIQLSANQAAAAGDQPAEGDIRIVVAQFNGKASAVIMAPIDKKAQPDLRKVYTSPVMTRAFDRVEVLKDAVVAVKIRDGGYCVEFAVPLKDIGFKPMTGKTRGDVGFISSDNKGMINTARTYWSNKNTNLVNDLPSEAWFSPSKWSEIEVK